MGEFFNLMFFCGEISQVVLSASHEQDRCYVMTANLDGETSLKTRFASISIIS